MKIYSALQIGEYHLNHCEDYLFIGNIDSNITVSAVMDGCTMGTDSYFIATLTGKLLRKIVKEKGYKALYQIEVYSHLEDYLQSILKDLFKELRAVKNQLMLDTKELLTTLIIALIDKNKNAGIVLVIGDGLVSINGTITSFDQDNKPDYLGFHLNEEFETWYALQKQKLLFNKIEDISIATDGIFMFTPVKKIESEFIIDPVSFMCHDKSNINNEDMLSLKLKHLEHEYGLKPTDDIAMIRLVNTQ